MRMNNSDGLKIFNLSPKNYKSSMAKRSKEDNPMRNIEIDKLVINCCVGEAGDKLTKAVKLYQQETGADMAQAMAALKAAKDSLG